MQMHGLFKTGTLRRREKKTREIESAQTSHHTKTANQYAHTHTHTQMSTAKKTKREWTLGAHTPWPIFLNMTKSRSDNKRTNRKNNKRGRSGCCSENRDNATERSLNLLECIVKERNEQINWGLFLGKVGQTRWSKRLRMKKVVAAFRCWLKSLLSLYWWIATDQNATLSRLPK